MCVHLSGTIQQLAHTLRKFLFWFSIDRYQTSIWVYERCWVRFTFHSFDLWTCGHVHVYKRTADPALSISEGIVVCVKTLDCQPRDCELNPPSQQLKLLKWDKIILVLPRKNATVHQCFSLGRLKNLVCHVWWALKYLALWATNRNQQFVCPDAEWSKVRVRR